MPWREGGPTLQGTAAWSGDIHRQCRGGPRGAGRVGQQRNIRRGLWEEVTPEAS